MRNWLLDILADPLTGAALRLDAQSTGSEDGIIEGALYSPEGRSYPIVSGIPRFVLTDDADQKQTESSFGYKWQQQASYDSLQMLDVVRRWLVQRYGFESIEEMRSYFAGRKRILDAGCGGGFSASAWLDPSWRAGGAAEWVGADISKAVDVAQARLGHIEGTNYAQADILQLPFREGAFDTIFSEGVLHHTPSTERALKSLVPLLEPGGELLFYVYRKKGAIREFTDDYIREIVSGLEPEQAWDLLRPLTRLGQALAELRVEVDVPEAIPYLGIPAGRVDVQRLVYWHFAKLFWNDTMTLEENNHVNFDWYHPRYAHRQTEEEVRRWCAEAGLRITHVDAQESGFTVRAIKD